MQGLSYIKGRAMEENKKKIDEDWKETVEKQKESAQKTNSFMPQEPDFNFFITTLALQGSIALGLMANPATNKTEQNLEQAKFLIDTLGMLKEKTQGNLTKEELQLLENLLYDLRTTYIAKTKEGPK